MAKWKWIIWHRIDNRYLKAPPGDWSFFSSEAKRFDSEMEAKLFCVKYQLIGRVDIESISIVE